MRQSHFVSALAACLLGGCAQPASSVSAVAPEKLEGAWRVEDVDHGGVIDGAEVTLDFGAGGKLSGRGGCNRYGGDYSYAEGVLTVGPLFSTKMACAPALMNLEAKFLTRLEGELAAATEEDGAISLSDDEGRILLRRASK